MAINTTLYSGREKEYKFKMYIQEIIKTLVNSFTPVLISKKASWLC